MKTAFVSAALLLSFASFAQTSFDSSSKEKNENIIIRKKGGTKEKTTIVIDGDKVTINGKPAEDYKNSDIEITENDNFDNEPFPPPPPAPALPPHGGSKMFFRNFNSTQNKAFLGVASNSDEGGATIRSVTKNSPAEKAGLKEGDVITKAGSSNIDDADDLMEAIGKYKPEDKVSITYKRDKKESTVTVTLDKNKPQSFSWNNDNNMMLSPDMKNFSFNWNDDKPRLGLRIQDTENGVGVKVLNLSDDDSPAAKAGLKEDDVITQINEKNILSVKDAKDELAFVKKGDDIKVNYLRGGAAQTATIHIPKPLQSSDL